MDLQHICRGFFPDCRLLSQREIPTGHINRSYHVRLQLSEGDCGDFLLQALNPYVFPQGEQVMENIGRITAHLWAKEPSGVHLRFYPAQEGNFLRQEGQLWRLCDYIPSLSYEKAPSVALAQQHGQAFGHFLRLLSDFPAEQLHETIPHFHDTQQRFAALWHTVEADPCGLAASLSAELELLSQLQEEACGLCRLLQQGALPLRVCHNDTKISNVLFDRDSAEVLCVIDLDTVMPGLAAYDFGDAIRSSANTRAEDCPDPSQVRLDLEIFRAFAQGYLRECAAALSPLEQETLALGAFCITTEQAVRFLDDYLQGSLYFRIDYPEHNLYRARCQLALAQDMRRKLPQMQNIVAELIEA